MHFFLTWKRIIACAQEGEPKLLATTGLVELGDVLADSGLLNAAKDYSDKERG